MGLGAIHEVMELCTYLALGEERGMLKPSTSYRFDNERDLTCNLAGAATLLVTGVYTLLKPDRVGAAAGCIGRAFFSRLRVLSRDTARLKIVVAAAHIDPAAVDHKMRNAVVMREKSP